MGTRYAKRAILEESLQPVSVKIGNVIIDDCDKSKTAFWRWSGQ